MGHLIPLAELAKRVAARHGATATLFTLASTASATQGAFLATLPPSVSHRTLLPVDLSDLNTGSTLIETLMAEECSRSLPSLRDILAELKRTTRLVAFVTDLFGIDAFDAAVGMRRLIFFPGSLHAVPLMLHLPEIVVSVPGEFWDLAEPLRLPRCVQILGPDVFSTLHKASTISGIVYSHTEKHRSNYVAPNHHKIHTTTPRLQPTVHTATPRLQHTLQMKVHPKQDNKHGQQEFQHIIQSRCRYALEHSIQICERSPVPPSPTFDILPSGWLSHPPLRG
jgi:hydroquinone glucosyltransferase